MVILIYSEGDRGMREKAWERPWGRKLFSHNPIAEGQGQGYYYELCVWHTHTRTHRKYNMKIKHRTLYFLFMSFHLSAKTYRLTCHGNALLSPVSEIMAVCFSAIIVVTAIMSCLFSIQCNSSWHLATTDCLHCCLNSVPTLNYKYKT